MIRREFIKSLGTLAAVPFFSDKIFACVPALSQQEHALLSMMSANDDRVFVVIQMGGGNDGLNMVLPLDQYSNLAAARANILIPDTDALVLGNFQTGLHPAMTGLKSLYDSGRLNVIQNVGYASPSFSHFRATDIFLSGSDSGEVIDSGWLGRYVEHKYPGFPSAYPNGTMPDPLAITLGNNVSQGLQGFSFNTSQTVPTNFSGVLTQLLGYANTNVPATNAGNEVAYIRAQQVYANEYADQIVSAWNSGANMLTYPSSPAGISNNLAQQLRIVAKLISGGLRTKIYWIRTSGYDTHASQVSSSTSTTTGTHANLLQELSDSIYAFMEDMRLQNLQNRVLGMTVSEFGRRIKSNSAAGTDHGTTAPVFMFGPYVNATVIGDNPIIPPNVATNTNLNVQIDYREIYSSVLQNWFCLDPADADTVLGNSMTPLNSLVATSCDGSLPPALPIELMYFSAEKLNKEDAHLSWATATEQFTEIFEIERSINAVNFEKIGETAAAGHSHETKNYSFIDKNVPLNKSEVFYYRLRSVDSDGKSALTETRAVRFDASAQEFDFVIAPNPSSDGSFTLSFNQQLPESSDIEIYINDIYGRQVVSTHLLPDQTSFFLDIAKGVPAGNYYVTVKTAFLNKTVKWIVA